MSIDQQGIETIEKLQSRINELEKSKWISVSEKLPEDQTHVQVYAPDYKIIGSVLVGIYFSESETFTVYDFGESKLREKVTHWVPLPEPTKEE